MNRFHVWRRNRLGMAAAVLACGSGLATLPLGGCDSLSPGFVNLLDPTGDLGFSSIDNAPGHIVIAVINNAEYDEQLLNFLGDNIPDGLTDEQKRTLRPSFRLRVRVRFDDANNTTQVIEMGDDFGATDSISGEISLPTPSSVSNFVVLCKDVAEVTLDTASGIEVFIPVTLRSFQFVDLTNIAGGAEQVENVTNTDPPRFRVLQRDVVDENGNVEILRNIGVRADPGSVMNPICGSVIAIVIEGTLSVPFESSQIFGPTFDQDNPASVGSIGGRYQFRLTVE